MALEPTSRRWLLDIAREVLDELMDGRTPELGREIPDDVRARRACFVTLTKQGELRGCVGHLYPVAPLYLDVVANTRSAAREDARFPPVERSELDEIKIEISVLGTPQPLEYSKPAKLAKLVKPGTGVILLDGQCSATFLPQVWEQLRSPEEFLGQLCLKAGLSAEHWRSSTTMQIETYTAEKFSE